MIEQRLVNQTVGIWRAYRDGLGSTGAMPEEAVRAAAEGPEWFCRRAKAEERKARQARALAVVKGAKTETE